MAQVVRPGDFLGVQYKVPRLQHGLPTPSPEPEDGRTATEKPNQVQQNPAKEIPVQKGPDSAVDKAGTDVEGGLPADAAVNKVPTPQKQDDPLPSVEGDSDPDGETSDDEDENKKPTEEAEKAINRILDKKSDLWKILDVEPGSREEIQTVNAFKELGCLLHPSYVEGEKTMEAFNSELLLSRVYRLSANRTKSL